MPRLTPWQLDALELAFGDLAGRVAAQVEAVLEEEERPELELGLGAGLELDPCPPLELEEAWARYGVPRQEASS